MHTASSAQQLSRLLSPPWPPSQIIRHAASRQPPSCTRRASASFGCPRLAPTAARSRYPGSFGQVACSQHGIAVAQRPDRAWTRTADRTEQLHQEMRWICMAVGAAMHSSPAKKSAAHSRIGSQLFGQVVKFLRLAIYIGLVAVALKWLLQAFDEKTTTRQQKTASHIVRCARAIRFFFPRCGLWTCGRSIIAAKWAAFGSKISCCELQLYTSCAHGSVPSYRNFSNSMDACLVVSGSGVYISR